MSQPYSHALLEDPEVLARLDEWDAEVYRDFLACEQDAMTEAQFQQKYTRTVAIMQLDMTGFTEAAMKKGSLFSLLRIFAAQKVCVPVLQENQALKIRAFADDLTATFATADQALTAALEIHRRIPAFNNTRGGNGCAAEVCIGLGYGEVFRIGPDLAMGDEMNRTSKLGEDTAKGGETLITDHFYNHVRERTDCEYQPGHDANIAFPFYRVFASA